MITNQAVNRSSKKVPLFNQLRPEVQAEIKHYLEIKDFRAAKAIYDKFTKLESQ